MRSRSKFRRNAEIFSRHRDGETYASLGWEFGVSKARIEQIAKRAAERLALGLPITLPASSGAWTVVRRIRVLG